MFALQKGLTELAMPVAAACAALLLALALSWHRPGASRVLVLGVLAGLWGLGSGPGAALLARPLEATFTAPPPEATADAAVVLAGTLDLGRSRPGRLEFNHRPERILEGAALVRDGRARWLVISGGSGDPSVPDRSEAVLLADLARALGVPSRKIVVEPGSRTTHENALNTAAELRRMGVTRFFLVTSALHMRRAVGCFQNKGLDPVPYPVDYRTLPPEPRTWRSWIPTASGLALSAEALHEYGGLAAYWVQGYL